MKSRQKNMNYEIETFSAISEKFLWIQHNDLLHERKG